MPSLKMEELAGLGTHCSGTRRGWVAGAALARPDPGATASVGSSSETVARERRSTGEIMER